MCADVTQVCCAGVVHSDEAWIQGRPQQHADTFAAVAPKGTATYMYARTNRACTPIQSSLPQLLDQINIHKNDPASSDVVHECGSPLAVGPLVVILPVTWARSGSWQPPRPRCAQHMYTRLLTSLLRRRACPGFVIVDESLLAHCQPIDGDITPRTTHATSFLMLPPLWEMYVKPKPDRASHLLDLLLSQSAL